MNISHNADGYLELIDQRLLPNEFEKIKCTDINQLFDAIKTLAVRGAPAIGVAAAYGIVIALQKVDNNTDTDTTFKHIQKSCKYLSESRPTAVNLFWALNRIEHAAKRLVTSEASTTTESLRQLVFATANEIYNEDVDMCLKIGQNGQRFIKKKDTILTHCNAGALATAGQGTALSVIFEAQKQGKAPSVYADETRPLLQGARLTAWELKQAGIDVTLICDNMAGWLMKQGKIDLIIIGADRIAANGDTANKIGTYSLAVLAKKHYVPFYIAAPSSTFDLSLSSGADIPIEQRNADEVTNFGSAKVAPSDIKVYNPAFDVTDAELITAIITENDIIEKPNKQKILTGLGE